MPPRPFRTFLLLLLAAAPLPAQGTAADYERAAGLGERWRGKLREFRPALHWLDDGGIVYRNARGSAVEFVRVAVDGVTTRSADCAELGLELPIRLPPQRAGRRSSGSRQRTTVRFENRTGRAVRLFWVDRRGRSRPYGEIEPGAATEQSTFAGHAWLADFEKDDIAGVFVATAMPGLAVLDETSRKRARARRPPAPTDRAFVRGHDVFCRDRDGVEHRLTDDGTPADGYRGRAWTSPDGSRALVFRVEPGEEHLVHTIESKPNDQVQPKLRSWSYRKPGDRIDRPRPRLFDLGAKAAIAVDEAPFADAWSIGHAHWAPDGSEVYLLHNRRGHSVLTLFAIDADTGAVRTVLEERSETFVDYSQKTVLHWLDDRGELLWASERSGYNHLYRVNPSTNAVVPVTQGEWVFHRIERVDEERGELWFSAYGIRPEQDPYHLHLARIGLDGEGLVVLTEGDGTHRWEFSPDGQRFVDRYSRVDLPEVTELRDASSGALIQELGRDDETALLAAGFRPPLRFVAPGRDGETAIHGILILPSDFDPERRYPVVEAIYAGPHDFHVPKTFGLGLRQRRIAELGFVVVQIDGMGTNWRSKAFHDVCWRNLEDGGFPDRIAWLRAAAEAHPWLDLDRVGIYGGSAGGQNALAALLHHGDFYDVAVADCGCHDNRMDKIWWNEAWMGWPVGPWYADNSNVTHAGKLSGKLLLTVGELDRNVDPASTMQVVGALIEADKDFDLVVVPGAGHGVGERPYLVRRRQDFFVRHLLGVEPPAR